ncbi:MAG: acyl-CoA thioesterase [Pseudomonadota bacterium]
MTRRKGRLWKKSWPDHSELISRVTLRVPFQDADPTGMAWHGSYFRFYDNARVELLKRLNFGYREMAAVGQIWPIVDTRVRYLRSIPFGEEISVSAQLVEWEFRLLMFYEICDRDGRRLNEAYTVQVPVTAADEGLVIGVPSEVQARVLSLIGAASADTKAE